MHNLNHSSCMIVLSSMFWWIRLWTCNIFTISMLYLGKMQHLFCAAETKAVISRKLEARNINTCRFSPNFCAYTRHKSQPCYIWLKKQPLRRFHRVFLRSWNDLHSSHFVFCQTTHGFHTWGIGDKPDQFSTKFRGATYPEPFLLSLRW